MMKLVMGDREMEVGTDLGELRGSNALLGDRAKLLERLADDGYLLIRGLHERERVLAARKVVIDDLVEAGQIAPDTDPMDAVINPESERPGVFWGGRKRVTHHPDVLAVLEGEPIMNLFSLLFDEPAITYDYKWLRAVPTGGFTGTHYDVVYMGRGTRDHLFTTWTPMGDVPYELSPLVVNVGSHRLESFQELRDTYGEVDVDRDQKPGWYTNDPAEISEKFGGEWKTTEFQAGDVILFTMFTLHGSTRNQTDRFRISTDTRYQPASAPVDERWVGDDPIGHRRA